MCPSQDGADACRDLLRPRAAFAGMGEQIGKTGPGVHFHDQFGQIESGQASLDRRAQRSQACGFFELFEALDGRGRAFRCADDGDGRICGARGWRFPGRRDRAVVIGVRVLHRPRWIRRRCGRSPVERLPMPGLTAVICTGVGIPQRLYGKEIAPADRPAKAVENTKPVTGQVERAVGRSQLGLPRFRCEGGFPAVQPLNVCTAGA